MHLNEPEIWINLLHDLSIITAALAAAIAAGSSLKNGRTLRKNHKYLKEAVEEANGKPPQNTTSKGDSEDWYKPPELWS